VAETILIVDDEESVRKSFREWLDGADLGCTVLTAADAETALTIANQRTVDLAVLDWNLGSGNNGLQLLEDLYLFNPDVVAIMITGYAHQATPLDAMRMGVRDYLDKNQDLHRETFLAAVRKQLARIGPAKRERHLHRSLVEFRASVEKILPLVRTAAALNDPVPWTESVRNLFRFLLRTTRASDGILVIRSYDAERQPPEIHRAYNVQGEPLELELVPFPQSLASAVVSLHEVCAVADLSHAPAKLGVRLQPFEMNRRNLLAAPLPVGTGLHVVLELFDKQESNGQAGSVAFTEEDRRLVGAVAEFGTALMKQALAERQTQAMLFDAVNAALEASQQVSRTLQGPAEPTALRPDQPPPDQVLARLRDSLQQSAVGLVDADQALKLAELLRVIAVRHGRDALQFALQMLESTDRLLCAVTGAEEARS
jgi:ActR/RegA family two-component response regulator